MPEVDPPVSDGVTDDDDLDGNDEEVSEEGGGVGVEETNDKKTNAFDMTWVKQYADFVHYYNKNGDFHVVRKYVITEGNSLGNWVNDQRKKYKTINLSAEQINMLANVHFEFMKQHNVVGAKLMVGVAISQIFRYQKENGNIEVPR
jgi:hypothetical protein